MQYLLSSNIWKNKNDYDSHLEDENSFNISKLTIKDNDFVKKTTKVGIGSNGKNIM